MTATQTFRYAWCSDHGLLHRFPRDAEPWCTACWVPFTAASEEEALGAKEAAYHEARFFDDLTNTQQLEVLDIQRTWE